MVFGNNSEDFTLSTGSLEAPSGPAPLAQFNAITQLGYSAHFTVAVDVGFSAFGVGGGVAFGIEQQSDSAYSYWQCLLVDGRSTPSNNIDVRMRKFDENSASNGDWVLSVNDRANYPNGYQVAPNEFFRIELSGQAGSALVDLRILNPDGTVKPVAHFEVDGGPDENPSHIETRFLQAELAMGGPLLDQHLAR